MSDWQGKPYFSLNAYLQEQFHQKLYKVSLNAGMTCPNRDGTLGTKGCIFCSAGGSGEFAGDRDLSITGQIQRQIGQIRRKRPARKFIAYFQAYTNTYAPLDRLEEVFTEALEHPDVEVLSIATRPDCLGTDVLELLSRLRRIKPVWVELGLQTIHERTAEYIRRGYPLRCFDEAVSRLSGCGTEIIVHTILGLPGETEQDVLETMEYLNRKPVSGIKLQLLHVLKGTDLAADYAKGTFQVLERDDYISLVIRCLEHLRPDMVIHRVTGDGPKDLLIAPLWSGAKRTVLNLLHQEIARRGTYQGRLWHA
jgi:radical SAM protein (TIGR01212 family)